MDGKGRWVDNVFVDRLWRSVKYEEVYLHACESVATARAGLGRTFRFYNAERRHQGLGRRTPDEVYADIGSWLRAACSRGTTGAEDTCRPVQSSGSTSSGEARQGPARTESVAMRSRGMLHGVPGCFEIAGTVGGA